MNRLRAEQITPRKITQRRPRDQHQARAPGSSSKDILIFTRQLATMIDAGLPLVQCLDILATQSREPALRADPAGGQGQRRGRARPSPTRSASTRKVFDELYVNLIAAGEVGGILDTILNRLGDLHREGVKLKRQVKSAMIYPSVDPGASRSVVVVVHAHQGHPGVREHVQGVQGRPPARPDPDRHQPVRRRSRATGTGIVGAVVALVDRLHASRAATQGARALRRVILRIPVIGTVLRKIVVARFTRTLGTLLSLRRAHPRLPRDLRPDPRQQVVEAAILNARASISEGKDLAGPLSETEVFPSMVVQMIGVGEQTGAMDQMLQKIADFYEDEVDVAVAAMTALIEPLMMVFLGGHHRRSHRRHVPADLQARG